MLGSADYTASNGTTVVLAAGATAGDLVETISFFVSSVLNAIPATAGSVGTANIANGVTINFADGSASTPSITNDGDTNTGIFFPAADTIAFAEGGVESMRINSAGQVGIGTSNPLVFIDAQTSADAYLNLQSTGSVQSAVLNLVGRQSSVDNIWSVVSTGTGLSGPQFRVTQGLWTNSPSLMIDSNNVLNFNSGYGSTAPAYGCRAWVNFNGTGTLSIRASGNVSSVTDNGVGNYNVNFATEMPNANYSANVTGDGPVNEAHCVTFASGYTTTKFDLGVFVTTNSGLRADPSFCSASVFR
jgi:hypothetical protein